MIVVYMPAGATLEEYVNNIVLSMYGPCMSALTN